MTADKKVFLLAALLGFASGLSAEDITFADSNVKALCVENWDSNKDGELSLEEAAAVATLGGVFRGNKTIGSFDELRYFTGLTSVGDYAFHQSSIRSVSFPSSVTSIGQYAFSESNLQGELRVPGTVKAIGDYAFYSCSQLTSIDLEEGVETVGWHSFSGRVSSLSLPSTLTFMSSMAIDPYVNVDPSSGLFVPDGDLWVYVRGTTPAAINSFAFYYVFSGGHLVVPFGTIEAYKAASGWSHFGEYLEFGDVNMDGVMNVKDVVAVSSYIMGNAPSPFNKIVADTNGDGEINVKDVVGISGYIMQK